MTRTLFHYQRRSNFHYDSNQQKCPTTNFKILKVCHSLTQLLSLAIPVRLNTYFCLYKHAPFVALHFTYSFGLSIILNLWQMRYWVFLWDIHTKDSRSYAPSRCTREMDQCLSLRPAQPTVAEVWGSFVLGPGVRAQVTYSKADPYTTFMHENVPLILIFL